jgi:branched-chain amino acid transport system ATP-binding protein
LIRAIAGIERPRSGTIRFAGRDITAWESHDICNLGISQVAEGRQLFSNLTTLENLQMGALATARASHVETIAARSFALFPRLEERQAQLAATLPAANNKCSPSAAA